MNVATPLLTFFLCIASLGAQAQTSACATQPISLPSGASASAYQWQIQGTGTWEDLDDNGEYSGTETNTLSIDPLELDMDGAGYRCLVPSAAACAALRPARCMAVARQSGAFLRSRQIVKNCRLVTGPGGGLKVPGIWKKPVYCHIRAKSIGSSRPVGPPPRNLAGGAVDV